MSLTSSDSHSGLMPPSVSVVVLPALTVSNLCLVFSSEGVRFLGMWVLNKLAVGPSAKESRVKGEELLLNAFHGKFLTKEVHQPHMFSACISTNYFISYLDFCIPFFQAGDSWESFVFITGEPKEIFFRFILPQDIGLDRTDALQCRLPSPAGVFCVWIMTVQEVHLARKRQSCTWEEYIVRVHLQIQGSWSKRGFGLGYESNLFLVWTETEYLKYPWDLTLKHIAKSKH